MFNGILYPSQKPAAAKLCSRKKMLLAHEQGLGKTVIAIAASEKLFDLRKARRVLVLAQPSNAWQWEDKIKEFSETNVVLVEAKNKEARRYVVGQGNIYYVVPWSLFRKDFARISRVKWDVVVADEAQEFKNANTKTARLMKTLNVKVKPKYRWALTGTAVSNKLEELYCLMYWVDKDFLPPWPTFEKNHIVRNQMKMIWKYKNLEALNKYLQKRMDRMTHADADMPTMLPPVIHKIPVPPGYKKAQLKLQKELDGLVANLYFDENGDLQGAPHNSGTSKAFHAVQELLASDEKLHYGKTLATSILAENASNKVVFFSRFKEPLYKLKEMFGDEAVLFTGDQKPDEKRAHVGAFLGDGGPRILLCSNAGAAGLDLYNANYVIHIDVPPSHGILDQRNKRITRISSVHKFASVHFLILERSIENFYYQVVVNKKKLADATLEGAHDEVITRPESLRQFLENQSDGL